MSLVVMAHLCECHKSPALWCDETCEMWCTRLPASDWPVHDYGRHVYGGPIRPKRTVSYPDAGWVETPYGLDWSSGRKRLGWRYPPAPRPTRSDIAKAVSIARGDRP